jgi:hypothetical protein
MPRHRSGARTGGGVTERFAGGDVRDARSLDTDVDAVRPNWAPYDAPLQECQSDGSTGTSSNERLVEQRRSR